MTLGQRLTATLRWLLIGLAATLLVVPILALIVRAPWSSFLALAADHEVMAALLLSLQCSLSAAALSALIGLPLATWLAGAPSPARTLTRIFVTLPMILPPVVSGLALLLAFGRNGLLGRHLHDAFGLALPFSTWGVIVAECYVAMPFFVLTVEGGLRGLDRRYHEAAATLGASSWMTFRSVTLPALAPTLRAALLVAWARALGEFGATITFAGNFAGRTRTMPLAVYGALETSPDAAIVLSLILVLVSAAILFVMRKQWFPSR